MSHTKTAAARTLAIAHGGEPHPEATELAGRAACQGLLPLVDETDPTIQKPRRLARSILIQLPDTLIT